MQSLKNTSLTSLIHAAQDDQVQTLSLIASENIPLPIVREIESSPLMGKYAEGVPLKRYYAGCKKIDELELHIQELARTVFKAHHHLPYVNVQPHAGAIANLAVLMALVKPGSTIMSMSLASGGHLTHGYARNITGQLYNSIFYEVDPISGLINYDQLEQQAHQVKPALIIAGASAYARTIDFARIHHIAQSVGALYMVDMAHIAGLVAAHLHPSPIPYADVVTSTTHKTLRGPRGAFIMAQEKFGKAIDRALMPGLQGGPFVHTIAAKGQCFEQALTPQFAEYQQQVVKNARVMAQTLSNDGAHLISGGTDTHLFLIDVQQSYGLSGTQAEERLESCGILVNRNLIPGDQAGPLNPSGIRLGTPVLTARGMREEEARTIAQMVHAVLSNPENKEMVRKCIRELVERFPLC